MRGSDQKVGDLTVEDMEVDEPQGDQTKHNDIYAKAVLKIGMLTIRISDKKAIAIRSSIG